MFFFISLFIKLFFNKENRKTISNNTLIFAQTVTIKIK